MFFIINSFRCKELLIRKIYKLNILYLTKLYILYQKLKYYILNEIIDFNYNLIYFFYIYENKS